MPDRRSPLELVPPDRRPWKQPRQRLNWGLIAALGLAVAVWAVAVVAVWLLLAWIF